MILLTFILSYALSWVALTLFVIPRFYLAVTNPRIHRRLCNPWLILLWVLETIILIVIAISILKH